MDDLLRVFSEPLACQMPDVMLHHLPLRKGSSAEPAGGHAVKAATSSIHVALGLDVMHEALMCF